MWYVNENEIVSENTPKPCLHLQEIDDQFLFS